MWRILCGMTELCIYVQQNWYPLKYSTITVPAHNKFGIYSILTDSCVLHSDTMSLNLKQ